MSLQHQPAEAEIDPGGMRIRQRLRALRGRYPGVALATELTHIHDDQVVIRAIISFPDGTAVSAYAAEPTDSTGLLDGALELAEQRATARALDLLGVGDVPEGRRESRRDDQPATPLPDLPEIEPAPEEPVRTPIVRPDERNTPSVVEALRRGTQTRSGPAPVAENTEEADAADTTAAARTGRPVITAPVTERFAPPLEESAPPDDSPTEPARRPSRFEATPPQPEADPDAGEPDMADYSWTHFWTWAREYDLKTKGQVEQRIGRTIDGLGPQEVRQLLNDVGIPL